MNEHLEERAELYALGDLTDDERREVEAHLAGCDACTRAVGDAEAGVAAMAALLPQYRAPAPRVMVLRRWPARIVRFGIAVAGVAAAFVAGWLVHPQPQADQRATLAMIHSHFAHVSLAGDGPRAKAIYAPDGTWLYLIVDQTGAYTAAYGPVGQERAIPLERHGTTLSGFVTPAGVHHGDEVRLSRDGRVIERAVVP